MLKITIYLNSNLIRRPVSSANPKMISSSFMTLKAISVLTPPKIFISSLDLSLLNFRLQLPTPHCHMDN